MFCCRDCLDFIIAVPVTFPVHHYSGLKEYIGANPNLKTGSSSMVVQSKFSDASSSIGDYEDEEDVQDQFYDAIAADSASSEDEESDDDNEVDNKVFFPTLFVLSKSFRKWTRKCCSLS